MRSALIACALVACGGPETTRSARPDVILVVIDTLRADALPFHGGPPADAPFLAALAAEGLVFERAAAPSTWTAPSTASIFTGLHPHQHGVEWNVFSQLKKREALGVYVRPELPADVETIPGLMRRHGYRTFGISDNPNVDRRVGFDRDFDRFIGRREIGREGADGVRRHVLALADEIRAARPWFLYLHLADPHSPYAPPAEWLDAAAAASPTASRARYQAEVRFADAALRAIFERLEPGPDALVIVTSDHGEEFGEHGGAGHGFSLYEELTHVPLVLHRPTDPSLRGRSGTPVSLVDLLPTLRDVLGDPPLEAAPGRSLLATVRDGGADRPQFAMRAGLLGSRVIHLRSVSAEGHKLIAVDEIGRLELYDLDRDPAEQLDLAPREPERVARLRARLEAHEALRIHRPGTTAPDFDPALARELEALGYGEGGENEGLPRADAAQDAPPAP